MVRQGMKFGADDILRLFKAQLGASSPEALRQQRVAEVRCRWKSAVESVYGASAGLVLGHTNAVYIMSPENCDEKVASRVPQGRTVLVVYSDDAMVRSDIDARQEFLKMKLNEQGERVEAMVIKASRQGMKTRRPFSDSRNEAKAGGGNRPANDSRTLDPATAAALSEQASAIENKKLRESILKALQANTKAES